MTRIFCIYFDKRPIWSSDCVVPIQAGRARTGVALDMLGDDTGDNISAENARYGEMTAWYWVWKNYLPEHPEVDYIGFSHYRRFLDFAGLASGKKKRTTYARFRKTFERHYREAEISAAVEGFDVVMRRVKACSDGSPRAEFRLAHPKNVDDWSSFERIVCAREDAAARSAVEAALSSPMMAQELQFVMRRVVFESFMEWAFGCCRACERERPWGEPAEGPRARIPAFLVERFFMVWLAVQKLRPGFRVKELAMVKLSGRPWWYRLVKPFLVFVPKAVEDRFCERFR